MYIYVYVYGYNVIHRPAPVFSSILNVHVSEMLCTVQRCCAHFPAVVHVSQQLCTFHKPPNNVLGRPNKVFRCICKYIYIYITTFVTIDIYTYNISNSYGIIMHAIACTCYSYIYVYACIHDVHVYDIEFTHRNK